MLMFVRLGVRAYYWTIKMTNFFAWLKSLKHKNDI